MTSGLVNTVAVCMLLVVTIHKAIADGKFETKTFNVNIEGEILVLDFGTVMFQGKGSWGPALKSVDACKSVCDRMPHCNAFTYCNNTAGCGPGCRQWADKKPNLVYFPMSPNVLDPSKTKLPILGFGTHNGGCIYGKDTWAQGVCMLKKVAKPTQPGFTSQTEADGWVSMTINRPKSCKGFSTKVCSGCLKSSDPKACFACAQKVQQIDYSLDYDIAAEGCITCFDSKLGAFKDRCVGCIQKGKACAECAFIKYSKQCFECHKNEAPVKDSLYCARCTDQYIPSEAAAIRCVHKCLPAVRKLRCKTPDQQNCVNDYTNICAACSKTASTYNICMKCATKYSLLGNDKCTLCGDQVPPKRKARCFQCAMKSENTGPFWCSDCLSGKDVKNREACLACVENTKISDDARQTCATCTYTDDKSAAFQKMCYGCLAKNPSDPYNACVSRN